MTLRFRILAPALLAAFVALAFAGCLTPEPFNDPLVIPEMEQTVYEVRGDDRILATLEVRTRWLAERLVATAVLVQHDSAPEGGGNADGGWAAELTYAARTGELLQVKSGDFLLFPQSSARFFPHFVDSLHPMGPETYSLVPWELIPLGPQWAVYSSATATPVAWGGANYSWRTTSAGWNASGTMPCLFGCIWSENADTGQLNVVHQLTFQANGGSRNWLPSSTLLSLDNGLRVRLQEVEHWESNSTFMPTIEAPIRDQVIDGESLCGWAPCEPDNWPRRLTIQQGLAVLANSSEWQQWNPTGAPTRPKRLDVFHGYHQIEVGPMPTRMDTRDWIFEVQKQGNRTSAQFWYELFWNQSTELEFPPTTRGYDSNYFVTYLPGGSDMPQQVAPLSVVAAAAFGGRGITDDVFGYDLYFGQQENVPAEEYRFIASFRTGCQISKVSLVTGEELEISPRQNAGCPSGG